MESFLDNDTALFRACVLESGGGLRDRSVESGLVSIEGKPLSSGSLASSEEADFTESDSNSSEAERSRVARYAALAGGVHA